MTFCVPELLHKNEDLFFVLNANCNVHDTCFFAASVNYMAPEVCTEGYSERSDIWSLGCVLFELVTSWLYSREEAVEKLKEIRDNPNILDEVFEEVSKVNMQA